MMPERTCLNCQNKKEWGCEAKFEVPPGEVKPRWTNPASMPLTIDGEDIYACPRQHIRENPVYWVTLMKFYGMYKKGFLPAPGGVIDQANKAIELFNILDAINGECDAAAVERQERPKGDPFVGRGKKANAG